MHITDMDTDERSDVLMQRNSIQLKDNLRSKFVGVSSFSLTFIAKTISFPHYWPDKMVSSLTFI